MTPRITPGDRRDLGLPIWLFGRLSARVMRTAEPLHLFTTLGRTRGLFWGWLHFASRLMPRGTLPRREGELVILRVAHLRGSAYERVHHERIGRRAGLTRDEIAATADGPPVTWSGRDAALLAATDELVGTRDLGDETWASLRRHLDERSAIEFLLLVGQYDMLATTLGTLRVEPDSN